MRRLLKQVAFWCSLSILTAGAQQGHAQWSYGSSGGSSGAYAVSYGSSGGSSGYSYASYGSSGYTVAYGSSGYGSSGYVGPVRRLAHRIHDAIHDHIERKRARHAVRRAAYGSSGYYYGSCGSSGYTAFYGSSGYSASYGSSGYTTSYGSYGSSGGSTGSVYYGASSSSDSSTFARLASSTTSTGELHLTVTVPPQAKVFVNDKPTTSTGRVRHFVSRGLEAGKVYRFQVRAELETADGEMLVESKEVVVNGGGEEALEFAFADDAAPVETVVTLHVPEDAQVLLAGNPTKVEGPVRMFRTRNLRPGQVWDDYEVEVRLGDQVKRQRVRLMAGDQLELSFNFDEPVADKVALR
ncbi:MAG: hypothetical protein KatS3mg111_2759 [Pirellulaceae bacterium]|nr:MAG: hypothetical protein KatS3mg111_2759 [Pirellulaceae bacterium]